MITLPPFAALVASVQAGESLDGYAPAVDALHDTEDIAAWLQILPASLHRRRQRTYQDGRPMFPEPDDTFGRTPVWKPRTVVGHYAESGRRPRPLQAGATYAGG